MHNTGRCHVITVVTLVLCYLNLGVATSTSDQCGDDASEGATLCSLCVGSPAAFAADQCCSNPSAYELCEVCVSMPEQCHTFFNNDPDEDTSSKGFSKRSADFWKRSVSTGEKQSFWKRSLPAMEEINGMSKRQKYFLGKRPKYFLGKRGDDSSMIDESEEKRAKYFLGKRAKYFLGKREDSEEKRAKYFLGKRADSDEKRAKYFLGKRGDEEKRAKYFLGKRQKYFLGKRGEDQAEGVEKRQKYFLGKKSSA